MIDEVQIKGEIHKIQDTEAREELKNKQDKLVSGENIKTINNQSILGSGNITISGGSGEGGTTNYEELSNKPKINNVELSGNKTLDELGIQEKGNYASQDEVDNKVNKVNGKDLSTNDFTDADKQKLDSLTNYDDTEIKQDIAEKQDKLISGTNIKTVNGQTLLGEGNIVISGGSGGGSAVWGAIGGNLSDQADLNNKFVNIEEKIPTQASAKNQLADKNFVNSSISTNTANFQGTFEDLEELKGTIADANDYAFYSHKDTNGNTIFDRYKYTERTIARIPEEYQEIQYVASNGTQFVDLKHKPTNGTKWVIDGKFNSTSGAQFNGVISPKFDIAVYNNKFTFSAGGTLTSVAPADVERHTFTLDALNGKGKVDDNSYDVPLDTISGNVNIFLFARNRDGSGIQNASMNVYSCKIYENNILELDLVPCYRKSDNKVGFYDLVNKEFLTSEVDLITSAPVTSEWLYEYSLNNSSFTAEQWEAINSELTKYVTANGFDKNKTQVLKNINGTLTWVDE